MLGFVVKIEIALKSGEKISFSGSGCQEATVNFFYEWPCVCVSPKQLGKAKDVDELIGLLMNNVWDDDRLIFAESLEINSDVVCDSYDAYRFIELIKENIHSMDDIKEIVMELREYTELHFYREYRYDRINDKYTGIKKGLPEVAEEYCGYFIDQSIFIFKDFVDCKIIKEESLYLDSDSDDIYFDWDGCGIDFSGCPLARN